MSANASCRSPQTETEHSNLVRSWAGSQRVVWLLVRWPTCSLLGHQGVLRGSTSTLALRAHFDGILGGILRMLLPEEEGRGG